MNYTEFIKQRRMELGEIEFKKWPVERTLKDVGRHTQSYLSIITEPPVCLRCRKRKGRYPGKTVNIPFTQPNRFIDPDIFTAQFPNIACKCCMDELCEAFKKWWQTKIK